MEDSSYAVASYQTQLAKGAARLAYQTQKTATKVEAVNREIKTLQSKGSPVPENLSRKAHALCAASRYSFEAGKLLDQETIAFASSAIQRTEAIAGELKKEGTGEKKEPAATTEAKAKKAVKDSNPDVAQAKKAAKDTNPVTA